MNEFHDRAVRAGLKKRLNIMPAVVVTGARQTGKSTLVQALFRDKRRYHSMDDLDVLDAANKDPDRLLGGDRPLTLDEVQHVPNLLLAVKRHIDV